jgi:hypothetical protein
MVSCKPTVLSSLFPMQTNQTSSETAPHMGIANPEQWVYNPMVHIVSHEPHACKLCAEWACHYIYSALDGKTSLSCIEAQWKTIILTSLTTKHTTLKHHYDVLQQTNAAL